MNVKCKLNTRNYSDSWSHVVATRKQMTGSDIAISLYLKISVTYKPLRQKFLRSSFGARDFSLLLLLLFIDCCGLLLAKWLSRRLSILLQFRLEFFGRLQLKCIHKNEEWRWRKIHMISFFLFQLEQNLHLDMNSMFNFLDVINSDTIKTSWLSYCLTADYALTS